MRLFIKVLFAHFFIFNILFADSYVDSLTLTKIKRLVQKEEDIALAYKKYIFERGTNRFNNTLVTVQKLIDLNYLPKGFNIKNSFGKEIVIKENHKLETFTDNDLSLKESLDDYFSNKYRSNTKAPLSVNKNDVEIILSADETYKIEFMDKITTNKAALGTLTGYYLDEKGLLHWYDSGNYKYTLSKDLIVDNSVSILTDEGAISSDFLQLVKDKNFMYAGQKILKEGEDSVEQYLNTNKNLVDLNPSKRVGKTLMRFTNFGAAVIINGDIFTWGNLKMTVPIGKNTYTNSLGNYGIGIPVTNVMINTKSIVYDNIDATNFNNKKFYSSPIRPNFIDFFSTDSAVCGVSLIGELYCGGEDILENNYIPFTNYTKGSRTNMEYLYRSTFFTGDENKAKSILILDNTYLVLNRKKTDTVEGYNIYFWGKDNSKGFAGTGNKTEINIFTPTKSSSDIRFSDITNTISNTNKKILGLDTVGNLYIWGLISGNNCIDNNIDSCKPRKLESELNFSSIFSGRNFFTVIDTSGNFYRVSTNGEIKSVVSIMKESYADIYNETDDARILSVDFSKKISNGSDGMVWVNSKNQLKGDYTLSSTADALFENAVSQIQWAKIKVIGDDNAMCGIDVNNQMYCWGNMVNSSGNGLLLPMFNANLHEETKDFLFLENLSNSITSVTSGDWIKDSKYFIKYPTYIGGFNYEFIFK